MVVHVRLVLRLGRSLRKLLYVDEYVLLVHTRTRLQPRDLFGELLHRESRQGVQRVLTRTRRHCMRAVQLLQPFCRLCLHFLIVDVVYQCIFVPIVETIQRHEFTVARG